MRREHSRKVQRRCKIGYNCHKWPRKVSPPARLSHNNPIFSLEEEEERGVFLPSQTRLLLAVMLSGPVTYPRENWYGIHPFTKPSISPVLYVTNSVLVCFIHGQITAEIVCIITKC